MFMNDETNPLLTIVIVNWNSGRQLYNCVSSISRTVRDGFAISGVVIVDNDSNDDSLFGVADRCESVRIIKNDVNIGFAAACNQGAAMATSDYLLFLNPDTSLFSNSLVVPIKFMQKSENMGVGICGIQLVDERGQNSTSAARFPSLRVMAGKILGLNALFPRVFPSHLLTSCELKKSCCVDQVIGAFFFIRKNVFDSCGGFDERFFVYFEEVDLSLRSKQLGFSSYFLSEVTAFHKGGGCSDRVKAERLFYSLRSRILYARKHYSRVEFTVLILLTGLELPLRVVQGVVRASWSDISNSISAYIKLVAYFAWSVYGAD